METSNATLVSLWIHVPIVTVWIGLVMWDLFVALVPGISPSQRGRMIAWSRPFVIIAIIVIMATGIWQTIYNPIGPRVTDWGTLQELKQKTYGLALFYKHIFVLLTFALTIWVRFVLAPRLRGEGDGVATPVGGAMVATVGGTRTGRFVVWASAVNALACLITLLFATRMIWTLH